MKTASIEIRIWHLDAYLPAGIVVRCKTLPINALMPKKSKLGNAYITDNLMLLRLIKLIKEYGRNVIQRNAELMRV